MQTDIYVTSGARPELAMSLVFIALDELDMEGVALREWPTPAHFEGERLTFDGELLLAWSKRASDAPTWRAMVAQERWRSLIHANYDMAIEGVCFAHAGAGREIGSRAAHFVCLQPHGGSRPLHAKLAKWLAGQWRGEVVDPFARGDWRPLLACSIANPDRAA